MLLATHFIIPHFSQTAHFADLQLRWEIASELALSRENRQTEHSSGRKKKNDAVGVEKSRNLLELWSD